jgi:hypothetical protein
MPIDEAQLEQFRTDFHLKLLELLLVKMAFLANRLEGSLSIAQTKQGLHEWLDLNSAGALSVYGAALQDPGLTALYSDEALDVTNAMKRTIDRVAVEAAKTFGQ